jgi:glyoxylase I family protein
LVKHTMYSFHHVGISVSDLTQSIAFYNLIGFKKVGNWKLEDNSLEVVDLQIGETLLELFCYSASKPLPEHSKDLEHDLPVQGTKHFGLKVASIREARQDVIAKDISIVYEQTSEDPNWASYFFIKDPDGILVEIIEDKRGY